MNDLAKATSKTLLEAGQPTSSVIEEACFMVACIKGDIDLVI